MSLNPIISAKLDLLLRNYDIMLVSEEWCVIAAFWLKRGLA